MADGALASVRAVDLGPMGARPRRGDRGESPVRQLRRSSATTAARVWAPPVDITRTKDDLS